LPTTDWARATLPDRISIALNASAAPRRRGLRQRRRSGGAREYPKIGLKPTGAAGESSESYPYGNIHKYIRQLYGAYRAQRFFWGTDITRMPCSWRECVTMFREELPFLKGRDLELVMGRAVCDWIGWKLPP
jgi:hypothetical protein